MRFLIEYKDFKSKETENVSLKLLNTFLNEHLIEIFHGYTFECMLIRFINNPSSKKKLKLKTLYNTIAEIELIGEFKDNKKINLEDFHTGLIKIEEAITKVYSIPLKEEFDYKGEKLLQDYKDAIKSAPNSYEELVIYANNEKEINFYNWAKRADCLMYSYSINPRPLNKRIVGIRIYEGFERGILSPFDYIYSELFSNLLRKKEIKLPGYDEIYISIAENLEEAKQEIALESWHKYTYSTLNLEKYLSSDDNVKSQMLFESICDGLRLIADFDHLEKDKFEAVIDNIKENGLGVELVYISKENRKYLVEILYSVPLNGSTKSEYRLRVTDITSKQSGTTHIDYIDTYWAPYSFGQILIKKEEIIIKGRDSFRAQISRESDKLPSEYRYKIASILNKTT